MLLRMDVVVDVVVDVVTAALSSWLGHRAGSWRISTVCCLSQVNRDGGARLGEKVPDSVRGNSILDFVFCQLGNPVIVMLL